MIKKTKEVVSSIEDYKVSTKYSDILINVATGRLLNGKFKYDGRATVEYRIADLPQRDITTEEVLTVDTLGEVILSREPKENGELFVDEIGQAHTTGQSVLCSGYSDGDLVTIKYRYVAPACDYFTQAGGYVKEDHAINQGLDDRAYNSLRLWTILLEMGLVDGEVVS